MSEDSGPPDGPPIAPLRMSFEVDCPVEHAFHTWTRLPAWWPADHTVTGRDARVVLQAWPGGRIFERTTDGREIDWGRVTACQAPHTLAYTWHLGADALDATDVEITFHPVDTGRTRVNILHRGWERLGAAGPDRRDANQAGWQGLIPHYRKACTVQGTIG